jgi:hypothetical protein
MERRKSDDRERRRRAQEEELRELERRSEHEQKNFEAMMSGITAAMAGAKDR